MSFTRHSSGIAFVLSAVYWTTWDYGNHTSPVPLFLYQIVPNFVISNKIAAGLLLSLTLLVTAAVHRSPFEPFTAENGHSWKWEHVFPLLTFLLALCVQMMLAVNLDYKDFLYSVGPICALLALGLNIRNILRVLFQKKLERKSTYVISLKKYLLYLIIMVLIIIIVKHFWRHVYAAEVLWRTFALMILGSLVEFRYGMAK